MRAAVVLHPPEDVAKARQAGALAARVLSMIAAHVRPGVSTGELDRICHRFIVETLGVTPANLGYQDYPNTILTSVNQVVCHGIPSDLEILREGDILNIDVAVIHDGWHGDTSRMYSVGAASPQAQRLIDAAYDAMHAGIQAVRPGARLGDVGHAIQTLAERRGFSVVREYCGHGIGRQYHDEPQVLHVGRPGQGLRLEPGMIFTIEPMLNAGKAATKVRQDGWTVVTRDNSLSAQWEHMVAVTDDGVVVLSE